MFPPWFQINYGLFPPFFWVSKFPISFPVIILLCFLMCFRLPVMGFYHRKLLPLRDVNVTMACGKHCSPTPSPLQSPALEQQLPRVSPSDGYGYNSIDIYHVLEATACTVGAMLFLLTMLKILGCYYSRSNYFRRRNSTILFDIHGDSPSSDDEGTRTAIHHPIWYINTVGLQQSIIDSITVCKYRKDDGLIEGTECPVCLGKFQEEESLRLLPKCSHAFHVPCIDTWLKSHKNCPLCRAPIVHDTAASATEGCVTLAEPDSNFSGQIQNEDTQIENLAAGARSHHVEEGEHSGLRVGDDHSAVFDAEDEGNSQVRDQNLLDSDKMNRYSRILVEPVRRSVWLDSCSASMIHRTVVDFNSDLESWEIHLGGKIANIAEQGIGSSTIYKLASIGSALRKTPVSMKRSSSSDRKFLVSRHCRSHSSTLPLGH